MSNSRDIVSLSFGRYLPCPVDVLSLGILISDGVVIWSISGRYYLLGMGWVTDSSGVGISGDGVSIGRGEYLLEFEGDMECLLDRGFWDSCGWVLGVWRTSYLLDVELSIFSGSFCMRCGTLCCKQHTTDLPECIILKYTRKHQYNHQFIISNTLLSYYCHPT